MQSEGSPTRSSLGQIELSPENDSDNNDCSDSNTRMCSERIENADLQRELSANIREETGVLYTQTSLSQMSSSSINNNSYFIPLVSTSGPSYLLPFDNPPSLLVSSQQLIQAPFTHFTSPPFQIFQNEMFNASAMSVNIVSISQLVEQSASDFQDETSVESQTTESHGLVSIGTQTIESHGLVSFGSQTIISHGLLSIGSQTIESLGLVSIGTQTEEEHSLQISNAISSKRKSYKCIFCKKNYKRIDVLYRHDCDVIDTTYYQQTEQRKLRPFVCNICGKRFSWKYYLRKHKLIHTKKYPFACHVCHKTFASKDTLRKHRRRKKFTCYTTCRFCQRRIRSKIKLMNHERKHIKKRNKKIVDIKKID